MQSLFSCFFFLFWIAMIKIMQGIFLCLFAFFLKTRFPPMLIVILENAETFCRENDFLSQRYISW
ncbi:unnamed protein product [Periconia digitata]|uniref:Uncharacterized protein n=1 Tax=Periconia digitata TaxID=1303443 RepID=A0A9W4XP22_9PLEO|nr:unnamed protein product [Periconia digitata]